jgi:hypothetical protein
VESIATGNEIANKLDRFSVVVKTNLWLGGIEVMNRDITDFEESLASGSEPSGNEVLHHLLLGIDRNTMPGQSLEIDAMTLAAETDLDSVVDKALPLHSIPDAHFREQVDRPLFQNPSPHPLFTVFAASSLDNDGFNALPV